MNPLPRVSWIKADKEPPLCDVPWMGNAVVLSDGSVNFCCFSSAIVGNVNTQSFEGIWNGEQMQRIRTELASHKMPPECQSTSCPIFRGDPQHFLLDRLSGVNVKETQNLESRRQSLAGSQILIKRSATRRGGGLEIELRLQSQGQGTAADLFVGIKRPDGTFAFLPGAEDYAVPYAFRLELGEPATIITIRDFTPTRQGSYEICAALFAPESNPHVLANCYWAETQHTIVSYSEADFDVIRRLATRAEAAGKWKLSARLYSRLRATAPTDFWDRFNHARALVYAAELNEASAAIAALPAQTSSEVSATLMLTAEVAERRREFRDAAELWTRALNNGAAPYWCLFGQARNLFWLGDFRLARLLMARALSFEQAEREGLRFAIDVDLALCDYADAEAKQRRLGMERDARRLQVLRSLHGMSSLDERLAAYELARNTGCRGSIVDLGCWLGSLTAALVMGLQDNPAAAETKVYAIDRFQYEPTYKNERNEAPYMDALWPPALAALKPRLGESFAPAFRRLTTPWSDRIEVIEADLLELPWSEPIELLIVDAMKTPALAKSIALNWFPHLMPGAHVFHQDYIEPSTWWIPILMYHLRDYFEVVRAVPLSSTVIFKMTCPLTASEIERALQAEFDEDETTLKAFAFSLAFLPPKARGAIIECYSRYCRETGRAERVDMLREAAAHAESAATFGEDLAVA